MKVQNYSKTREGESNNIHAFSCVLSGHIEMTWKEWMEATKYLLRAGGDYMDKKMLREDILRTDKYLELYNPKRITWRNIRVTYTEKLFKRFNLPR